MARSAVSRGVLSLLTLACQCVLARCASEQPILLLLSFDGFRYDYLYKTNATHLDHLRRWAFVPHVRPVFPAKTFPNHVSIATGLYAESHGVIGPYLDPETRRVVDMNETDYWNYNDDIQPIWSLNEAASAERHSACMMWPGCYAIKPPTYVQVYNKSMPWRDRVSTVFDWLRDTDRPANLVMWYFEEPDATGHHFGPDSPQVVEQIRRVDEVLGYIVRMLRLFELDERVNLVVTSDHGMAPVPRSHVIDLGAVVDPGWYTALGPEPVLRIVPAPGKSLALYDRLRDGAEKLGLNYTVYVKEKIPERWHYGRNPRVTDILLVADEGYMFMTEGLNETLRRQQEEGRNISEVFGDHGYDPASRTMDHPLLARGPAFRRRFVHTTLLENVDLRELAGLALRLSLPPANGSRLRVQPLLAPASLGFWAGAGRAGFWAAVSVAVIFGICVLTLLFVVVRRSLRKRTVSSSLVNGYMFRYSPVHVRPHGRADRISVPAGSDDDCEEVEHLLSESRQPVSGV